MGDDTKLFECEVCGKYLSGTEALVKSAYKAIHGPPQAIETRARITTGPWYPGYICKACADKMWPGKLAEFKKEVKV